MSYPNRFKGDCKTCGTFVPAGAGIYEQGMVTCTDTVAYTEGMYSHWVCLPAFNSKFGTDFTEPNDAWNHEQERRDAEQTEAREQIRANLVNGELERLATQANVRSLAQVIAKVTGAERELADLDWEQATDVRKELYRRIDRKLASKRLDEFKASDTCSRCGGAGRADKWAMTGYTCYQCGGTGKYFNPK